MATITALKNPSTVAPLDNYSPGSRYCELIGSVENRNRHLTALWHRLQQLELQQLRERSEDAERELYTLGITFTVYSDRTAIDRILPFDVIPRVITAADWRTIDRGVKQRIKALESLSLGHLSRPQRSSRAAIGPSRFVLGNACYRPGNGGLQPSAYRAPIFTSAEPTSSVIHVAIFTCWKTMAGRRPACPMWWRTGI